MTADETREQKIRARIERLRSAGPIDVAADPGMNALRMIAHSDADDLAYLLEELERVREAGKIMVAADDRHFEAANRLATENVGLQADLATARAEVERLRGELLKRGDHEFMCMAKFNDGPCSCGWDERWAALAWGDGE